MELARGQVTDRPWGMTLAALGARQATGQLTVRADGKRYCIVLDHGAVVGATSPLASDVATRVALIHQMIAPAQVADLARRIAAAPGREEIEVLAEAARLTLDQTLRLRRKVIEQRAARTFSLDAGEFVLDSHVTIPILTGFAIDVRSVIYHGARMNLSEPRLADELRRLGLQFVLKPEASGELEHFGFTDTERPILEALRAGTSLPELEARHRDIDPRTMQAVIYALVSCSLCTGIVQPSLLSDASEAAAANDFSVGMQRGSGAAPSDVYSRARTGRDVFVSRPPSESRTSARPTPPRQTQPPEGAPRAQARAPAGAADETGVPRAGATAPRASTSPGVTRTPPVGTPAITGRSTTPPGVPAVGRAQTPNSPPPGSGRTPTPSGVPATGRAPTPSVPPATGRATTARATVTGERARTSSTMSAVSGPDSTDPNLTAPDPAAAAKEAFKRGQSRLRVENLEDAITDLSRAVELAPNEVDYAATLAWARFCHATDKQALAQVTREALARAIRKSPMPEMARFYLGRVERMLGRDREALRHFQQVLEAQPRHADAAAEVRVIEARMAQAAAKESGVFGRKR